MNLRSVAIMNTAASSTWGGKSILRFRVRAYSGSSSPSPTCTRHENSRRHHRRAWGTIKAGLRNQTDALYLNGPIFLDFGPRLDFLGQKGPKRSNYALKSQNLSKIERDKTWNWLFWGILGFVNGFMLGFVRKMAHACEEPVKGQNCVWGTKRENFHVWINLKLKKTRLGLQCQTPV